MKGELNRMKLMSLKQYCKKCDKILETENCSVELNKFINYKGYLFHIKFSYGTYDDYISIADPYLVVYGEEYNKKTSYKNIKKQVDKYIKDVGIYE